MGERESMVLLEKMRELLGLNEISKGHRPTNSQLPDLLLCLHVELKKRHEDCTKKRLPKTYISEVRIVPNTPSGNQEMTEYIELLGGAQEDISKFFKGMIDTFIKEESLNTIEMINTANVRLEVSEENGLDEKARPFKIEFKTVPRPKTDAKETKSNTGGSDIFEVTLTIHDAMGLKNLSLREFPKKCGRSSEIKISSKHTSGHHFDLTREEKKVLVIDRSSHGTFTTSGEQLEKGKPFTIEPSTSVEFVLGCGRNDSKKYIYSEDKTRFAHVTIFNTAADSEGIGGCTPEPGGGGTPPPGA